MNDSFQFSGDPAKDWPELCNIWRQSDQVLSGEVGATWRTPIQHQLCLEFAEHYPDAKPLLIDQLSNPDPRLAAYAFKILIRLDVDPKDVPREVVRREEQIGIHIHSRIRATTIGEFVRDFFGDYDFESLQALYRKTQEWQEGPLAEYDRAVKNEGEQDAPPHRSGD
ncbi:MAG: hypothetical protein C0483_05755 [Pirellula sp.]|nr:hypothetical protein [Pirellula sp.]